MRSNTKYNAIIDHVDKAEWTNLLLQFKDATIYQTWSYGAVRWGENHLSHIILKKDDEVIGMAQASIFKLPYFGRGIAYIPWGPVWRKRGRELETEDIQHMIKALNEEYVMNRHLFLRINPQEIKDDDQGVRVLFEANGFHVKSYPYRTLLIDLSLSMEDILKSSSRRWRRALKEAEQKNLRIIEGTGNELYELFKDLYNEMLERKQFVPTIDIDEFQAIQKDLPESIKMKIMICEFKGKAVSALIASLIGTKGIGLLGATGNVGMNLGSFHILNWRMMAWMKSNGALYYDFGGYNPEENPGTASFKEGLPGKDVTHIGQFEACRSSISYFLVNYGERIRSNPKHKITLIKKLVKLS
jgi:lipid II:glycine glycyltransferase (peptidoglycan interpeptide bridge formation enzyme)